MTAVGKMGLQFGGMCVCVVGVEKEKGKVQRNSIAMLVVNDLYNKCIPFFQAKAG